MNSPILKALVLAVAAMLPMQVLAQSSVAAENDATSAEAPRRTKLRGAEGQSPVARTGATSGTMTTSQVGEAGRRQSPDDLRRIVEPLGRINSRIANRVQSRIRNRIDRNYDPQANAISPFKVAEAERRTVRQRR